MKTGTRTTQEVVCEFCGYRLPGYEVDQMREHEAVHARVAALREGDRVAWVHRSEGWDGPYFTELAGAVVRTDVTDHRALVELPDGERRWIDAARFEAKP